MKRIAVILPDEKKLAQVKRLLADYRDEAVFEVGSVLTGVQLTKELLGRGIEVVIARGENAENIRRAYPEIIVVDVSITGFDLVLALEHARQFGDNIAAIAFPSIIKQIECLETALGVRIRRYNLASRDKDHVNEMIDKALAEGAHVILGGFVTTAAARERKLPCVHIDTGNQAYVEAFLNARALLASVQQEKRRTGLIKTVLNHAYEGILAVDESCNITVVNPVAKRILQLEGSGQKVSDVWPELGLDGTVKTGGEEVNRIYTVNNIQVLCSKVPIKDGKTVIGAVAAFQDITKIQMAEARIRKEVYSKGHIAGFRFRDICGSSKSVQATIAMAKNFSAVDASILITGETGTGKEVFAQSIHNDSRRAKGPFVAINCAALPPQLLESELFGYVGGAFTGANKEGKAGLFEVAHTGTIFLDEIGEMDYGNQGRLLRVLQEKAVMRLGSDRVVPVDVRIVAATNKNLAALMSERKFREDLYYRLNVLQLNIPPLRERKRDIAVYAGRFLSEIAPGARVKIGKGALKVFMAYGWPGNIRELRNVIERIVALARRETVSGAFAARVLGIAQPAVDDRELEQAREIARVVESCNGRLSAAAEQLKISRSTLWRRMKRLGLKE